ncbi:hypothetical protein Mapa_001834 [Marchantia paleacea]|nr:hypothetical protein Mapa_001834 [Marchantia paleacea]
MNMEPTIEGDAVLSDEFVESNVEANLEGSSNGKKSVQIVSKSCELELPEGLKTLLQRLDGELAPAVDSIPILIDTADYGNYFRPECSSPIRKQVRIKVLSALGKCKTLRTINNYSLATSDLSVDEWEALLIPLQSVPGPETVIIHALDSDELEVKMAKYWQGVVQDKPHSLKRLGFYSSPNSDRHVRGPLVGHVAAGFTTTSHVALETIRMGAWEEASVAVDVARMLECTPRLRNFSLVGSCKFDEVAKQALSSALSRAASLKVITLFGPEEELVQVLTEAFVRVNSSLSLESVFCEDCDLSRVGDALGSLLTCNIPRISVGVRADSVSSISSPWNNIVTSLLCTSTLQEFRLDLSDYSHPYDASSLDYLASGIKEIWRTSKRNVCFVFG